MKKRSLLMIVVSGILFILCMIVIKSNIKKERHFDTIKLEKEPDDIFCSRPSENLAVVTDGQLALYNGEGKVRDIETKFKVVSACIRNNEMWVIDDKENLYKIDYDFIGPVSVSDVILKKIKSVYCDTYCQYAIDEKGQLYAWGENLDYTLGLPEKVVEKPTLVPHISNVKKVAVGNGVTVLLMEDGSVYEAGRCGKSEELDEDGEIIWFYQKEFTKSEKITDVIDIFGGDKIFAVCKGGELHCWVGVYEDGAEDEYIKPKCEAEGICIFSSGYRHWLGMNDKGDVYYWGLDILKEPDCKCLPTVGYPTKIPEIKDAEMIYSGGSVGYVKKGLEIIILSK